MRTPPRFLFMAAVLLMALAPLLGGCGDEAVEIPALIVPDEYPYPQAAIDAAEPGDLVLIRPGVYTHMETRHLDPVEFPRGIRAAIFPKDGVLVEGSGPPGSIVFRDTTGADTTFGAAFVFTDNTAAVFNLAFEGFHIGMLIRGDGGSAYCCRVTDGLAGIHAYRCRDPRIVGNFVDQMAFDGILNQFADAVIAVNLVRDCGAGIGIEFPGTPLLQANLLCGNAVGIGTNTGATANIQRNFIRGNSIAGMVFAAGALPVAVENDLLENPVGILVSRYDPPLETQLVATDNYWDTVDTLEVSRDLIHDGHDDPSLGATVRFLPISPALWASLTFSSINPFGICTGEESDPAVILPRLGEAAAALGYPMER